MFMMTGTDQKERLVLHPGLLPLFSGYRAKQGLRKSEIFTGNRDGFPIRMQMHCDDPRLEIEERLEERELDLEDMCRKGV